LRISKPQLTRKRKLFSSRDRAVHDAVHVYDVRRRKDKRGVDLISDVLPFKRFWYVEQDAICNAIGYAMHRSRSHDALIRV